MTQGAPASNQQHSSFASPPGLEDAIHKVHETVQAAARQSVEARLNQLGSIDNRQDMAEAARQTVLDEVEQMIGDACGELLLQGKQKLTEVQQRNREKDIKLEAEVELCLKKQRDLEQQNNELKQVLAGLATTFGERKDPLGVPPGDGVNPFLAGTPVRKESADEEAAVSREAKAIPDFPFGDGGARGREAPKTPDRTPGIGPASMLFATPGRQVVVLAEALGPRTPVNIAKHLALEVPPSPAVQTAEDGTLTFTFTLRKADGNDLGLSVAPIKEDDKVLHIDGIKDKGAVQAWNKLWLNGPKASKAVQPGDTIVSANSVVGNPTRMLEECKEKQLVALTIHREPPATTLNPAASEFVPRGVSSFAPYPNGDSQVKDVMEVTPRNDWSIRS